MMTMEEMYIMEIQHLQLALGKQEKKIKNLQRELEKYKLLYNDANCELQAYIKGGY